MLESSDLWFKHVQAYMNMNLSKESDRTMAFSGIVSSFGQSQKLTGTYLAGLWRSHLPFVLCWYVDRSKTLRSSQYTAPSWTWASLHGPFKLGYREDSKRVTTSSASFLVTLDSASITSSDSLGKVGSVVGGAITVRGNITGPVTIGTNDGTLHLVDEKTGEQFVNPRFDENDENGPLITSMDSRPSEKAKAAIKGAMRQVERLTDYRGSLFILPIAHVSNYNHVHCLILYQPLREGSVFYRVGCLVLHETPGVRDFQYRVTHTLDPETLITVL
ncbi:hypothetical protein FLONG3_9561 [Fusarium longipes]|uniref:Uncharacterized protein n=1 Tax=Fusarium longipes TaxID=694270 RepID=A0A395RWI4_9HYPO|nr:hypothetical protein FLONG3_9561 [Fusarium longipes]